MPERHSGEPLLPPIADVARSVASAQALREVLQRVAGAAVELTRARGAYVEQVASPRGMVEIVAVAGQGTPPLGTCVPYPGSLTEEVIEGAEPALLTGLQEIGKGIAPYLSGHCDDCSGLVVPLLSAGEVLGTLVLLRGSGQEPFAPDDVSRARTLGDLASVSLKRVQLLEESRREREQMAALLDSTGEGIYGVDVEDRCTFLNRSGARMLGYEPEEVLGENMHDLVHYARADGAPYPQSACPIYHAARTGEGIRVDNEVLWRKDGTSFPAEYGSYPVRLGGKLVGAVVTFQDVSERRAAETALRESEQRFRSVAENAADAIITIDVDENIVYANRSVGEVFGYTAEELRELPFTALIPERLRRRHEAGVERHVATGERRLPWDGVELPGLHKDGHEIPLEITFGESIRNGRHLFTGIMRDISERKRAEAERERLLERERFLVEVSTILASSLDYQATLERVARLAVPRIADYCMIDVLQEDGLLHRVGVAHMDPAKGEILRAARRYAPAPDPSSPAWRVIETGKPELIADIPREWLEETVQNPEHLKLVDRLAPRSLIVVPLTARDRTLGILWLVASESGRRYSPDDLSLAEELARRAGVAVDNAELFEDSEQRREEVQRVMESRARLMRGFSHDVKNPLGAADGFLALLEDGIVGELSEKQTESVSRARRSIGNSLRLIDDLLELARAEAGQIEMHWAPVDVRDAAREVGEEFRAQAEAKGLSLTVELPEELPLIESDATRVRQILANLLSNAVKYTEEGSIRLRVELRSANEADHPGEWIATEVSDTGSGIPREKQRLLFQEFTRLNPGETKGAGIGLAISQKIAHAIGGEITAVSEADEGSTFTLWLPCAPPKS